MNLYILCILVILTKSLKYFRLTAEDGLGEEPRLTPADFLYSTLGNFRIRLIGQTCQLRIEEFGGSDYKIKGYFPEDALKVPCAFVVVKSGALLTETDVPILKIKYYQLKNFRETTFTIDDLGVLRLSSFSKISNENLQQQSQEVWVSTFRSPNIYLYSTSNIVVTNTDSMSLVVNEGGWGFSARNGQFRIFNTDDPSQIIRYRYNSFTISPGRILDRVNHEPPTSSIEGMNYQPRCGDVFYMDFQFPLIFRIDKYWPELRVLDQRGYELLSVRYPTYNCIADLLINPIEEQKQCIGWFCPEGTFQLDGQCVLVCPFPYYHQIKVSSKNRCILNCEQGSTINQTTRVCTCESRVPAVCSSGSKQYALGCYCKSSGFYYNGITCSRQCPMGYAALTLSTCFNLTTSNSAIPEMGGVCIECPYQCLRCQPDSRKIIRTFLICLECRKGYTLFGDICRKECQNSMRLSQLPTTIQEYVSTQTPLKNIEINCESQCSIQFCEKCTKIMRNSLVGVANNESSKQLCVECMMPLILFKNACLKKCPQRYILRATNTFHFYCEEIKNCDPQPPINSTAASVAKQCVECNDLSDICWIDCEKASYFSNQSRCFCLYGKSLESGKYSYGYSTTCASNSISGSKNPSPPSCKLNQYLYEFTMECLACPFGCLTCLHDFAGFIECTSCAPSYFLMIDINSTHFCQRDTSLTLCKLKDEAHIQKVYSPQFKICSYATSTSRSSMGVNSLYDKPERIKCRQNDPYCLICLYQSSKICTFCSQQYFLYKNKCVRRCPRNTIQHQKICIQNTMEYCQNAAIVQHFYLMNISQSSLYLEGYDYFLPSAFLTLNKVIDPIGIVFLYANLYSRDIGFRISSYPEGVYKCTQCQDGYAINIFTGECQMCVQKSCLKCVNSIEIQCYKCTDDYKLDQNYVCVEKSENEKDCRLGQFKNEWRICTNVCPGFWIKQETAINCSRYCHSNWKHDKYYRIEEDHNRSALHLLCIPDSNPQVRRPVLTLIPAIHRISQNIRLLIMAPLQGNIHAQQSSPPDIATVFRILNQDSNKYSYEQLAKQDILKVQVEKNKISIVVREKAEVLAVRFDVSRLHGRVGDAQVSTHPQHSVEKKSGHIALQQSKQNQSKLFLPQSEYMFTPDTPQYSSNLSRSMSVVGNIIVVVTLVMSVMFLSQQMMYKTDNLIVLLQTLPLFLYSLDSHLLDLTYYQFLYNFRLIIFNLGSSNDPSSVGNSILRGIAGTNSTYTENLQMNMLALVAQDGNIVRHCIGLILALAGLIPLAWILSKCCMRDQIAVFWRKRRQDRQLSTHFDQTKVQHQGINTVGSTQNPPSLYNTPRTQLTQLTPKQTISTDKPFKQEEIYLEQSRKRYESSEERKRKNRARYKSRQNRLKYESKATQSYHNIKIVDQYDRSVEQKSSRTTMNPTPSAKPAWRDKLRKAIYQLTHPGNQFHKYLPIDIDHFNKVRLFLVLLFETSSMVLVYFSIVTLRASPFQIQGYLYQINSARAFSVVVSVFVLLFIVGYSACRWWAHRIGGFYMMKRFAMGITLGLVQGASFRVIFCAFIQIVFMCIRVLNEQLPFMAPMKPTQDQSEGQADSPGRDRKVPAIVRHKSTEKQQSTQSRLSRLHRKSSFEYRPEQRLELGELYSLQPIREDLSMNIKSNCSQRIEASPVQFFIDSININRRKCRSESVAEMDGRSLADTESNRKDKPNMGNHQEEEAPHIQNKKRKSEDRPNISRPNARKCDSFRAKLRKLIHVCRPYSRLLSLLMEQLLLIIAYLLLSQTDKFCQVPDQYYRITQGNSTYGGGLVLTILFIMIIICLYLAEFGFELMSWMIESWVKGGLTQREKRRREGMLRIQKLRNYWMEQREVNGYAGNRRKQSIKNSYVKYFNELTYKEWPTETSHMYFASLEEPAENENKKGKDKEKEENEKDIFNYEISSQAYEYIY